MNNLLLDTPLTERQRRCAEVVRDSATSLLGVLDDILDWSKIDAGKMVLEKVDFDLRALLESITDLFAAKAQQKGLEITCFIAPDAPTALRGDPVRLRQVLINLLGNAVKFTIQGGVSLRVKLESEGKSPKLRFEVSDTGIGLAESSREFLFRPFSQADSSTTRHYGGTGLGLSIVQKLVELMNGEVSYRSREGDGSTFWFTASLEQQPGVTRPRPLSLAGHRVLVVDSKITSREFLCDLLNLWSCSFEHVSHVDTALTRLRECADSHPFEALILDSVSVGIRGSDLIQQLAFIGMASVAVIELVPLATLPEQSDSLLSHRVTRVAKPVKQGELGKRLATVLGYGPAPISPGVSRMPAPDSRKSLRERYRLLVVEDNETNQEVAVAILETLGYRNIAVVSNGREALDALSRHDFNLVLMDCQMPEMDGYEASRLIRQANTPVRHHDVPIVAMTAHSFVDDRRKCLDAGMNDYLTKPIARQILEQTLDRWLGTPKTGTAEQTVDNPNFDRGTPVEHVPNESETIFDRDDLLSRVMGNTNLAHRVVARFLSDMPHQLLALSQALSNADSNMARITAHSIKGAAANVGGTRLRKTAQELELLGEAGNLDEVVKLVPQLTHDWEHFRAATGEFLQR